MLDISSRLLPLLEFVYAAVEDPTARASIAKAVASAITAEWVVLRVTRTEYLTPSPDPNSHRLVGRWPAWDGAEVEVVACRNESAAPFGDADCRIFAAFVPHLARAARLAQWGVDAPVCLASTAWAGSGGVGGSFV